MKPGRSDRRGKGRGRARGAAGPTPGSAPPKRRIGVWLLGAQGGLATTVMVGARLLARGLAGTTGLLTEGESFRDLDLVPLDGLVFGGHDIRSGTVFENACEIEAEGGKKTAVAFALQN